MAALGTGGGLGVGILLNSGNGFSMTLAEGRAWCGLISKPLLNRRPKYEPYKAWKNEEKDSVNLE